MLDVTVADYLRILGGVSWRVLLVLWVVSAVAVGLLLAYALLRYPKPAVQEPRPDEDDPG